MYKKKRKKDISKNFDRLTLILRKQRQEFCSNIAVMSYRQQQITTEKEGKAGARNAREKTLREMGFRQTIVPEGCVFKLIFSECRA